MDWTLAIEKNREALRRILVTLVAMVQAACSAGPAPTLPRQVHRLVLRLVRPAEAATRRLIIVAARGLVVEPSMQRSVGEKVQAMSMHAGKWTGIVRGQRPNRGGLRSRSLPLLDPLKTWAARRRPKQRDIPRISFFDAFDRPRDPDPLPLSANDPIDARAVRGRLEAIGSALDDLPRQAIRLARWRLRMDLRRAAQDGDAGVGRTRSASQLYRVSPMRPGRPPGWRRRPVHAVDELLNTLHGLAFWVQERPDTS